MSRRADLEARLAENPDDRDTWAVYEDWLMETNDPRARLVKSEHAGDKEGAAKELAQLDSLVFGSQAEKLRALPQDAVWRAGYVRKCLVHTIKPALVGELFATPAMRFVADLHLIFRDAKVMAELPALPQLRRLRLRGLEEGQQLELDAMYLGPLRELHELEAGLFDRVVAHRNALPALRALTLVVRGVFDLDVLVQIGLPQLARLELVADGIVHTSGTRLGDAMPVLRSLVVNAQSAAEAEQLVTYVIDGGLATTLDHLKVKGLMPRRIAPAELADYRDGALARISSVELPSSMI